jgi:hypothetical protein
MAFKQAENPDVRTTDELLNGSIRSHNEEELISFSRVRGCRS